MSKNFIDTMREYRICCTFTKPTLTWIAATRLVPGHYMVWLNDNYKHRRHNIELEIITQNKILSTEKHNMRVKQAWMFKGAIVLALGKKAIITDMQENTLDGTDYVYYITCKIEGEKYPGKYHPNDIQELAVSNAQ